MKVEILIGVAGVGKSTYIRNKITEKDLVLSSDELRKELFGSLKNQDKKSHSIIFNELAKRLRNAVNSKKYNTIFYDATNLSRKNRKHIYKLLKTLEKKTNQTVEVSGVCLLKPLKDIYKQNAQRTGLAKVPNEVVLNMYKSLEVPKMGIDCDVIEKPYGNNFKDFEYELEHDLPHDSTWHKETIKEHIELTVENAEKTGNDDLIEIARFHDLGKFVCKQWTSKERKYANFIGHENVSAMYYLANLDLKEATERDFNILDSIKFHMLAHQGITDKIISNNGLNKETLAYLNKFKEIDSISKIEWTENEYKCSLETSPNSNLHFNPNKGKFERCYATIRPCSYDSIKSNYKK